MKTQIKTMFGATVIEFPMVIERIRIYETLVANNVAIWTPETEWTTLDVCKAVKMTAKEMAWFARI